jgi:hypothetical protein
MDEWPLVPTSRLDLIKQIWSFLQHDTDSAESFAHVLLSADIPDSGLANILSCFCTLAKSAGPFTPTCVQRLRLLSAEIATIKPSLSPLFHLTHDRPDTEQLVLADCITFNTKHYPMATSLTLKVTKYQLFKHNPEGFANLISALVHRPPPGILPIIGEYNLDVDAVLLLVLEMIPISDSNKLFDVMRIFPLERLVDVLSRKMRAGYRPCYDALLLYLFDAGVIPEDSRPLMLRKLEKLLGCMRDRLFKVLATFCGEVARFKKTTRLPEEPKESLKTDSYKASEAAYLDAYQSLYGSPHFRFLLRSIDVASICRFARFDPCAVPGIATFVTDLLMANPNRFDLLCILSCHCDNMDLVARVCKIEDLPAHVFSYFLLPVMAMRKDPSEIEQLIWPMISRRPFGVRCQIYRNAAEVPAQIAALQIKTASISGVISRVCRRLTTESARTYSGKIVKLVLAAPSVVIPAIIHSTVTCPNCPPLGIPVAALGKISCLGCDFVLWLLTDFVDRTEPSQPVSEFMAKLVADHYETIDFVVYLDFLHRGLRRNSLYAVQMLCALVTAVTGYQYRGDLCRSEIEERSGDSLLRIKRGIKLTADHITERTHFFEGLMTQSDSLGLRFLSLLDKMNNNLRLADSLSQFTDSLDRVRFTFLTLSQSLDYSGHSPIALMKDFQFSLGAAFHVTRLRGEKETESFAPDGMPPSLFAIFWNSDLSDFHVPVDAFDETLKQIDEVIANGELSEERKDQLELRRGSLEAAKNDQIQRCQEVRAELSVTGESWFENPIVYTRLIEHCIIPRVLISQLDGLYASIFIFNIQHTNRLFSMQAFMDAFLSRFHFIVFSVTFEEVSSFGILLSKLLKTLRDRDEEEPAHCLLMKKIELLLRRKEWFVLGNSIRLLWDTKKYFPKYKTHHGRLVELCGSLDVPAKGREEVSLRLQRYINDLAKMPKIATMADLEEDVVAKDETIEAEPESEPEAKREPNSREESKPKDEPKNEQPRQQQQPQQQGRRGDDARGGRRQQTRGWRQPEPRDGRWDDGDRYDRDMDRRGQAARRGDRVWGDDGCNKRGSHGR